MPVCSCGLCGQGNATSVEMVRPEGSRRLDVSESEVVELSRPNAGYAGAPLLFGGYPVLLYRLPFANSQELKDALSKALLRHPWFAGRLYTTATDGGMDGRVVLNNVGVPFTVVRAEEANAPGILEETSMLAFGHLPSITKMMRGEDAVMTVKLTIFRDKSAVLAIARSHALADGTYTWAFINDWAAASLGKALRSDRACSGQESVKTALIEDVTEFKKVIQDSTGIVLEKKWWAPRVVNSLARMMDLAFYAGFSKATARTRLMFSNADLDRIKKAASPPLGSTCDGWVSTQEAFAAHILVCLGRALIPAGKVDAVTGVDFWLDARKMLGLPHDAFIGLGFAVFRCDVERLPEKKLWQVASAIHDELKTFPQKFRERYGIFASAMQHGLSNELMLQFLTKGDVDPKKGKYDVLLQLNNQSKRTMPDFGNAAGVPSAVLTNAGPSLLLPTPGGVELFLVSDVFGKATGEQKNGALKMMSDVDALES